MDGLWSQELEPRQRERASQSVLHKMGKFGHDKVISLFCNGPEQKNGLLSMYEKGQKDNYARKVKKVKEDEVEKRMNKAKRNKIILFSALSTFIIYEPERKKVKRIIQTCFFYHSVPTEIQTKRTLSSSRKEQ